MPEPRENQTQNHPSDFPSDFPQSQSQQADHRVDLDDPTPTTQSTPSRARCQGALQAHREIHKGTVRRRALVGLDLCGHCWFAYPLPRWNDPWWHRRHLCDPLICQHHVPSLPDPEPLPRTARGSRRAPSRLRGCAVRGCNDPHLARGLCGRHYRMERKYGTTFIGRLIDAPDGNGGR